jgi:ABC-type polysaccharide/polyol phosphate transport system ATPase subunit
MSDADRPREHQARWAGGGIPAERLAKLTDVIAEFAQLDEYIDFPLRTYSTGKRIRR